MKIAVLHNGEQLQFPDETPDPIMDQAVQQHLAESQQVLPPDQHLEAMQGVVETLMHVIPNAAEELGQYHQATANSGAQLVQIMAGMNQGVHGLVKGLAVLQENTAQIPEVVAAINNLSKTFIDSTQALLQFLALRRDIIYTGETPTGIQAQNPRLMG